MFTSNHDLINHLRGLPIMVSVDGQYAAVLAMLLYFCHLPSCKLSVLGHTLRRGLGTAKERNFAYIQKGPLVSSPSAV